MTRSGYLFDLMIPFLLHFNSFKRPAVGICSVYFYPNIFGHITTFLGQNDFNTFKRPKKALFKIFRQQNDFLNFNTI